MAASETNVWTNLLTSTIGALIAIFGKSFVDEGAKAVQARRQLKKDFADPDINVVRTVEHKLNEEGAIYRTTVWKVNPLWVEPEGNGFRIRGWSDIKLQELRPSEEQDPDGEGFSYAVVRFGEDALNDAQRRREWLIFFQRGNERAMHLVRTEASTPEEAKRMRRP